MALQIPVCFAEDAQGPGFAPRVIDRVEDLQREFSAVDGIVEMPQVPVRDGEQGQGCRLDPPVTNLAAEADCLLEVRERGVEVSNVPVGIGDAGQQASFAIRVVAFPDGGEAAPMGGDPVGPSLADGEVAPQRERKLPRDVGQPVLGSLKCRGDQVGPFGLAPAQRGAGRGQLEWLTGWVRMLDRKSTRLNSSHEWISYAVFCLKKKKKNH